MGRQPFEIDEAVAVLQRGGLVAFPTETVYGLGADAENAGAVEKIFAAKGRPANHPLIVHVASKEALDVWAIDVPEQARRLAERFWPGPLTMVLSKSARVPLAVTGGQQTVGLRVPAHPVARALLDRFGGGIAAPSANRFGKVSPTRAEHVRDDLGELVDYILDGGACTVGIESTIIDLTSTPAILRPGGVSKEELEALLGQSIEVKTSSVVRAPGQLESHYAPRARVIVVPPHEVAERVRVLSDRGWSVVALTFDASSLEDFARELYASFRAADARGAEVIVVGAPTKDGLGLAILDRLSKASSQAG